MTGQARLDEAEGLRLLTNEPLDTLCHRAHEARLGRHPDKRVTYVLDTNPNYTNICPVACAFCAFRRRLGDEEGYLLSPEQLVAKVAPAVAAGARTILLQGGLHPEVGLRELLAYLKALASHYPTTHLHPFSPPEILHVARRDGISTRQVLEALWAEGIRTLPGGGAEILVERVRKGIAPAKATAAEWLAIMEEAHTVGFHTTATMMFGHMEEAREVITHLSRLRDVQDRTGGFASFIPWSFKPGGNPLGRQYPTAADPVLFLRILATARLFLDNFPHIQSSWFGEGKEVGQLGLLCGADDFGGTLFSEEVLARAGHTPRTSREEVCRLIKEMGFTPAERDSHYRIVEIL